MILKKILGLTSLLFILLMAPWAWADEQQFFNSTHAIIPPSSMVMSLPTPNDSSEEASIWNRLRQDLQLQDQYNRPEVIKWIKWLQKNPKILIQVFRNAKPYLYYVLQQTERYQLPAEFALLPVIESGYNPYAFSSTGAVGIWQMMPGTAMIYGLDINWWYDGRRDIISSTDRALTFLDSLHQNLGDWLLAAAAYDAGAETIQKAGANRGGGQFSFWQLSLSKETQEYVPRLLAVAAIVADPQRYGLTLPFIADKDYFASIKLNFQLDSSEIARLAQVSLFEIQQLNPGMRRWATSPEQQYTLLLPIGKADIFRSNLAHVAGQNHVTWQYHEVHDGQTLASIAANYHTSVDLLQQVNDLNSEDVASGQGLVVPLYLHRKYQLAQVDVSNQNPGSTQQGDLLSPDTIKKITSNEVLSGQLNQFAAQASNAMQNQQLDNPPDKPITSLADASHVNQQIQAQTMAINNKNASSSSQAIHDQDNLRTILNKLYKKAP